jgi:hypothetical protein
VRAAGVPLSKAEPVPEVNETPLGKVPPVRVIVGVGFPLAATVNVPGTVSAKVVWSVLVMLGGWVTTTPFESVNTALGSVVQVSFENDWK